MSIGSRISDWIKARRLMADITQTELADMLGFNERSIIAKIEGGKRQVSLDEFVHLCRTLDEDPVKVLEKLLQEESPR